MANEQNNKGQIQQSTASAEQTGRQRQEQFNELSELSLEERMAVADQIGVPLRNVADASFLGTISGGDEPPGNPGDSRDGEIAGEETDR